jgi:hypothetical protein
VLIRGCSILILLLPTQPIADKQEHHPFGVQTLQQGPDEKKVLSLFGFFELTQLTPCLVVLLDLWIISPVLRR